VPIMYWLNQLFVSLRRVALRLSVKYCTGPKRPKSGGVQAALPPGTMQP